jgi:HlyD family secretion protein
MKRIISILILLLVAATVVFVWQPFRKTDNASPQSTTVSTAVTRRGDLTISVNSTGVVEPISQVDLKSKASGEIIEFPVEEGQRISKGQLIVRLDATTAQNDHEQAVADLEVARVALEQASRQAERQAQMFLQGLISELDYDAALLAKEKANSDVVRAETTLEAAKERLSDTVIKSPIDGIMLEKHVEQGQIIASGISAVSGGTIIATIADLSKAYVKTSVDEVDIGQIQPGQKAVIIAESYPDREFEGEVLRIHPLAKTEQNVTIFEVTTLVDNAEGLLMAGMNANVEITAGSRQDVLIIPREALTDAKTMMRLAGNDGAESSRGGTRSANMVRGQGGTRARIEPGTIQASTLVGPGPAKVGGKMVIVINNGQQEPRSVEIGISNFEEVEIISGLAEGDTVLTSVTSKALKDREEMLQRMRDWNQIPGMQRRP